MTLKKTKLALKGVIAATKTEGSSSAHVGDNGSRAAGTLQVRR